jgi:hypothetical protein
MWDPWTLGRMRPEELTAQEVTSRLGPMINSKEAGRLPHPESSPAPFWAEFPPSMVSPLRVFFLNLEFESSFLYSECWLVLPLLKGKHRGISLIPDMLNLPEKKAAKRARDVAAAQWKADWKRRENQHSKNFNWRRHFAPSERGQLVLDGDLYLGMLPMWVYQPPTLLASVPKRDLAPQVPGHLLPPSMAEPRSQRLQARSQGHHCLHL